MNQTKLIEEQKRGKRYIDDEDLEKTQEPDDLSENIIIKEN